jgi:branched-chain amino acid transport system substrate-binding protein
MGKTLARNTLWLVVLSMLLPLVGCKDKTSKRGEGAEILIGEYGSMTGDTATFGTSSHEGLMLAIEEINKAGGVLGKQIKVISEDDRSEPSEAVTAVQKLISRDKVVAVIGEVASTRSMAGAGPCQQNKIPMLSPASTNPQVTKLGDYIFRICFTDDFQGKVAARFAQKKGWKRVAVLTDAAQDYSKGLTSVFNADFPKGGGQVVASDNYKSKDNDFQTQLSKIKAANVDAVFMPGYYTDVGNVLRQARQIGLTVPFFGCDGWDSDKTLALGAIADGCFFTNHYSPDDPRPEVQKFIADYKARYGGRVPDAMAILGYDAARVMADAIRRAGKADPAAIRDALAQTKDFPGASGKITIDAGRNALKPIVILELRGGKTKMVDAIAPE